MKRAIAFAMTLVLLFTVPMVSYADEQTMSEKEVTLEQGMDKEQNEEDIQLQSEKESEVTNESVEKGIVEENTQESLSTQEEIIQEEVIEEETTEEQTTEKETIEKKTTEEETAEEGVTEEKTTQEGTTEEIIEEETTEEETTEEETVDIVEDIWINPLYRDIISRDDVLRVEKKFKSTDSENIPNYNSADDAINYIKQQMVARQTDISFTMPASNAPSYTDMWNRAMEYIESCSGCEGDALKYCIGSTRISISTSSGVATYSYTGISYYTDASQENELTSAVNSALNSLNLNGLSEYEKILAIYDYICDHVDYDYDNLDNSSYYLQYTAYAALCKGKAVCQGYAVLFYRMCKDAGLSVRVIDGTGNGGAHAWNIVRLGNCYYNMDVTWDGQDSETRHNYFLKSDADFTGHTRSSEYSAESFYESYPMSTVSYSTSSGGGDKVNLSNNEYTYTTIDGNSVSSTASGKPKILVFFSKDCGYSRNAIQGITSYNLSPVDVYAIEAHKSTQSDVIAFKNSYGNDDITFAWSIESTNNDSMWDYIRMFDSSVTSITFPVVVYIDSDNLVQYITKGAISGSEIVNNIVAYCDVKISSNSKCIVKYVANGGIGSDISEQYSQGEQILIKSNIFTRDDFSFLGWNTKADGSGIEYQPGQYIDVNMSNIVLYAQWKASVADGLGKNQSGDLVYYKNGVQDTSYNGLASYNGANYYVENGKVNTSYTGMYNDNGNWIYITAGQVDVTYTGMASNEKGWWYYRNGQLDWNYTGMASNENGWWYYGNGQLDWNYTGMASNENGWWYYRNGQLDWNYTGMASNENGWWYYQNGQLDWNYTGMASNENGWWYYQNGQLDWNYTGMASNENGWWYYQNGQLDWNYTGMASNENGWWYFKNGNIDWSYTGIGQNEYGYWYYNGGQIAWNYSGIVNCNNQLYSVNNGFATPI